MNKTHFQILVRRVLNEEISKRVPEMNANGINPEKKNKIFSADANSRDTKSKDEMLEELQKAVKSIDSHWVAVWDDHDDLKIDARDMGAVWITPLWEDNFKIVFMPRNEDRFFFTGLTWGQVLDFVKDNLDQRHHTGVEKARDKSWRNQEDQVKGPDKGLSQKNKPNVKKGEKLETMNKEEDNPDQPMKEAGDVKFQREHKAQIPPKRLRGKPVTKFKDYQR